MQPLLLIPLSACLCRPYPRQPQLPLITLLQAPSHFCYSQYSPKQYNLVMGGLTGYFLTCYWRFLRFNTFGTIEMPIGANNWDVQKLQEQIANMITLSILTCKKIDFSLLVVSKGRNLRNCWSLYLLIYSTQSLK